MKLKKSSWLTLIGLAGTLWTGWLANELTLAVGICSGFFLTAGLFAFLENE